MLVNDATFLEFRVRHSSYRKLWMLTPYIMKRTLCILKDQLDNIILSPILLSVVNFSMYLVKVEVVFMKWIVICIALECNLRHISMDIPLNFISFRHHTSSLKKASILGVNLVVDILLNWHALFSSNRVWSLLLRVHSCALTSPNNRSYWHSVFVFS